MTFKFVTLFALLAVTTAGFVPSVTYTADPVIKYFKPVINDGVASTQHNVLESLGGTVPSYSKAFNTPYSSAHKMDTRINSNFNTPTVGKTVVYAAPVDPTDYTHAASSNANSFNYAAGPAVRTPAGAPTVYTHSSPAVKTVLSHKPPAVYSQPAVVQTPLATAYNYGAHSTPGVSAAETSQTVHYSPAEMVSHMSFEGFGTHWGF